jgi:hypothetical protein
LFYGGPGIDHILLEQSSTAKDVVGVKVIWTWVKAIGVVEPLGHLLCTCTSAFIDIHGDVIVPALLALRKYENIVKSRVCMTELAGASKLTALKSDDKITFVNHDLRSISRHNHSNFIGGWEIISSTICALLEVNACTNLCVLLRRLLSHDLIGLLINSCIGMGSIQHVMEGSENLAIKTFISRSGGTDVSGLLWIIDVDLCIGRLKTIWRYETAHEMVKGSMNTKCIWAGALNSMTVNIDADRRKCKSAVVLTNLGPECVVCICLLQLGWPCWERLKTDLALQAAHTKEGISCRGLGESFACKVPCMAAGALYVKRTKSMKRNRLCIWTTSIRDRNDLVDKQLILFLLVQATLTFLSSSSFLVLIMSFLRCWIVIFAQGLF